VSSPGRGAGTGGGLLRDPIGNAALDSLTVATQEPAVRLLPARRETTHQPVVEPDGDLGHEVGGGFDQPRRDLGVRELARRAADVAVAAHREHVPF